VDFIRGFRPKIQHGHLFRQSRSGDSLVHFPKELGSRLAIYSETLMPDRPASELVQRTQTYPVQQLEYAFSDSRWPYGYGLGTCTLGTQYVMRIMQATRLAIGVESGFGNIPVELGFVGLILWNVLGVAIGSPHGKVVSELRGTPWFPLAYASLLYVCAAHNSCSSCARV
jgi:hypothetical protein